MSEWILISEKRPEKANSVLQVLCQWKIGYSALKGITKSAMDCSLLATALLICGCHLQSQKLRVIKNDNISRFDTGRDFHIIVCYFSCDVRFCKLHVSGEN